MNKGFVLDQALGYFKYRGVDIMAFDDIYPDGHQSGVSILMHGSRVATNGDIRFEQTPGQWQPLPKQGERALRPEENAISTRLHYPDMDRHLKGFNPLLYPDCTLDYTVTVRGDGEQVVVTVDLDAPIPPEFAGKICFNMELFPGALFGKPWIMDGKQGVFPRQPNGPVRLQLSNYPHTAALAPKPGVTAERERLAGGGSGYSPIIADDLIAEPYAAGCRFTVRPDDPLSRFTVETRTGDLKLYDGRMNHNNGWFVLSSEVPCGATKRAVEWIITPNAVEGWRSEPVVQVSQVGYLPGQPKIAVIELDAQDEGCCEAVLERIDEGGAVPVLYVEAPVWGRFLRYRYRRADFSAVKQEGLYRVRYGDALSAIFRIAPDLYDRGVWQPVLEYFLPVQMCHMRVMEKYRVWHDLCHNDDARMAPINYNHIDGYVQGPSTLTQYRSGESVPGLNAGGWHDAGDFDLRVESQAGECYILALAYEAFGVYWDATTVDQAAKRVEIHQPDGRNDILQQIEHGALSVVGAYRALGRLYRGVICSDLRQYVLLGDAAAMTDNIPGNADDRWVFTEDNPPRELTTAAQLAATTRVLKGFNDELAEQALTAAQELYRTTKCCGEEAENAKLHAAAELLLTTGEEEYRAHLLQNAGVIAQRIGKLGWIAARAVHAVGDPGFTDVLRRALPALKSELDALSAETPYGIPYRPHIWGAGWDIQRLGFQYYFLHRAFPDLFGPQLLSDALNFILGCHPGSNAISFASGVGAESATIAYGLNRADFSFIPGGVISGTALIRPDFPELLPWPFLWQQTEYVLGGGSSHYMFLVLAARQLYGEK
ncbi:MAG: glycoside hydrolase family 9 protein [Eubacteriales bacterium]|nr:glycoside hydrolase family 9 protein [Eubacteriales bacterium]